MLCDSEGAHPRERANAGHLSMLGVIRQVELEQAMQHFPPAVEAGLGPFVLEIGAGTGEQARAIAAAGYEVLAVDVEQSHYRNDRVFDVLDYDGAKLPVPDGVVDVVFSSNVLEHVEDIDMLLEDMSRVLSNDGMAVHVLPSSACRLWSIPAHYGWLMRRVYVLLTRRLRSAEELAELHRVPRRPSSLRQWIGTLFPLRHGERGTTITEAYYYSRFWWGRKFRQHGFEIVKVESTSLFYSMANVFGAKLPVSVRRRMAPAMGASCNLFVLKRSREG